MQRRPGKKKRKLCKWYSNQETMGGWLTEKAGPHGQL